MLGPDELREEAESRLGLLQDRHVNGFEPAEIVDRPLREAPRRTRSNGRGEAAIRPERFARLRHPRRHADRVGQAGGEAAASPSCATASS